MRRIRVLLVALPPLLGDILNETLAGESDMIVVGRVADRAQVDAGVRQHSPDVVLVGAPTGDITGIAREIMNAAPSLTVVVIAPRGDQAVLVRRGGIVVPLHDVSPTILVMTIRDYSAVNGSTRFPPASLS